MRRRLQDIYVTSPSGEVLRKCKTCEVAKAPSEFYLTKSGCNQSECKECRKATVRLWNAAHAEQHRAAALAWVRKNPERRRAYMKEYMRNMYLKNREAILARNAAWTKNNPKKHSARTKRWLAQHPGKNAEYARRWLKKHPEKKGAWQKNHPERARESGRRWRKENPAVVKAAECRRRSRETNAKGRALPEQIKARVAFYGNRCAYCGGPYEHLDHVIPLAKGGTNWPANLRPACRRCNVRKQARTPKQWKEAAG